ncbi:MAG TPA: hypothetical protein VLY63_02460 [Anaerolineae bacterium]|nr:hypothetical protein [Anaerolineae bacterium]
MSLSSFITLVHLLGLVLGVGAATAKLVLLVKSSTDRAFVPIYLRVARLITRQIIVGMVLLTLSGIGWLLVGYPFTPLLVVKVVLFGVIWVLGPVIDNVVEPRFQKLIPESDQPASPAFIAIQKRYLALEITATLLFYVVIVIWVVR